MNIKVIKKQYGYRHCGNAGIIFFGAKEDGYELRLSDDCQEKAEDVGEPGSFTGEPMSIVDAENIYNADPGCWWQYQWFRHNSPCEKPLLTFEV